MSDIDDINAQHLASMGLADATLGQPYDGSRNLGSQEGRCPATLMEFQCAREEDHSGVHARGRMTWDQDVEIEIVGPTKVRDGDQVLPSGDESLVDDQQLLIDDIEARRQVGIERYGQGHRPFNGRNTILDAYEEALDSAVYLRSLLRVREATRAELIEAVEKAFKAEDTMDDVGSTWRNALAITAVDRLLDWATLQKTQES